VLSDVDAAYCLTKMIEHTHTHTDTTSEMQKFQDRVIK
jgi:hypothetical protein